LILIVCHNSQVIYPLFEVDCKIVDVKPVISYSYYGSIEIGYKAVIHSDVQDALKGAMWNVEECLESQRVSHRPFVTNSAICFTIEDPFRPGS